MTKNKNNKSSLAKRMAGMRVVPAKKAHKKNTPFADVGSIIGKSAGNLTGMKGLAGVGKWLGSGIGSIFGSGDYTQVGPTPGYNILAGQTPKFSSTHATNIVCHREYLGDIGGLAAFNNSVFPLQPGSDTTFPWLSSIAANYQQYRFHGLIFEFRPLVTDFVTAGSPGVIVMTTNYNADQNAYSSRQEAENAEFAVSCKPTTGLVHMIECKPDETANKLYNIRTGPVPSGQDLRLYDYGNTQVITQNNPSINLGELWVSYCVEFFKPTLSVENNSFQASGNHLYVQGVSNASPLGTIQLLNVGTISCVRTSTSLTYSGLTVGTDYQLVIATNSVNTATTGFGALSIVSGGAFVNGVGNGATPNVTTSIGTTGTLSASSALVATLTATAVVMVINSGAGTYPVSCNADIWLSILGPFE